MQESHNTKATKKALRAVAVPLTLPPDRNCTQPFRVATRRIRRKFKAGRRGDFVFELDHIFVLADIGAPEAETLISAGLTEGEPNVHPGQGTANRRFFFQNAFLELLWVSDPEEAQSELVRPIQLWQRWSQRTTTASPFGVCFRPTDLGSAGVPFPSWEYRPRYLPSPLIINVGEDVPLSEPLWFYLKLGRRPNSPEWPSHQPLRHALGFQEITQIRFTGPFMEYPSEAIAAILRLNAVAFAYASQNLLEVTFDGGTQNRGQDFRPVLPVVFRW